METSNLTPRQYWAQVRANPARAKFGFGSKAALINIDLQRAYTDVATYRTAYETDPRQLEYMNSLAELTREQGWPVIWTYIAYLPDGSDAGVWGTRTNTEDSLQNIKEGSDRAAAGPASGDRTGSGTQSSTSGWRASSTKHQSASLLNWHRVDTVILTGGSTSGCVRASAVDALSRNYRVIIPEECVADRHEIPHFASLCDLMLKYADVEPWTVVRDWLAGR